jgi:hypothetical protein
MFENGRGCKQSRLNTAMVEKCACQTPRRPPAAMVKFVRSLVREDYVGRQKRRSLRVPLVIEVQAVPVDEDLRPKGPPLIALVRNISTNGTNLVHTEPIRSPFLRLQIHAVGLETTVFAKVLRCRQLKRYFEIGCEFIARTDRRLAPVSS